MNNLMIYTDGSCIDNPGPGGWAVIIVNRQTGEREEFSGGKEKTTNNRMELLAVIAGLRKIKPGDSADLFTDSAYVKNGITKGWLENWKRNGWLTSNKKPVQNIDMWQKLDELLVDRNIDFKWIKGHSGNEFNELCDKLAYAAAQKSKRLKITDEEQPLGSSDIIFEMNQNSPSAKLKLVRKLQLKKNRAEMQLFVAEGLRLCETALDVAEIEFGFYTEEFLKTSRAENLVANLEEITTMYKISAENFNKVSDTQTPQGIMVVAKQKTFSAKDVLKKNLIIALEGVQDPGNVGTILRTASAFDCGVILLDGSVDIFNPKVVRSTMGAIFTLPTVDMTFAEFKKQMTAKKFELTAAALDSSAEIYFNHNFAKKSAIIFGNEGGGVSKKVLQAAEKIYIPMPGNAESLNVATAAAVIVSEVLRQRS